MPKASIYLINSLREAAQNLREGAHYVWGNHGACNCGQLLQVIANLTEEEILRAAHTGVGEWTELGVVYCHESKTPVDTIFSVLEEAGLTPTDIAHLEHLSDKAVLKELPGGFRWLKKKPEGRRNPLL